MIDNYKKFVVTNAIITYECYIITPLPSMVNLKFLKKKYLQILPFGVVA